MATNKSIVLVDDDEIDIQFLRKCLDVSALSNPFLSFRSGGKFLDYMKNVVEKSAAMPALVLLDVNMPGMNGFEVVSSLRVHPEFSNKPMIIFLTTSDSPLDKQKAESLGLRYVEKFFNRADAVQFLESLEIG